MNVTDHLNNVLANVLTNKAAVHTAIKQTSEKLQGITPEVQAAIDVLTAAYPNVQEIGTIIGSQMQLKTMEKTSDEIDALIASVQLVLSNETLLASATDQLNANTETENNPLPDAAGASTLAAADSAEDQELAAELAKALGYGASGSESPQNDGAIA